MILSTSVAQILSTYDELKIGDRTVGWISPHFYQSCINIPSAQILVDGHLIPVDMGTLKRYLISQMDFDSHLAELLDSRIDFILDVPSGFLDLSDWNRVSYTHRSCSAILTVLTNFIRILESHLQSVMDHLPPAETKRVIWALLTNGHQLSYDSLRYRGARLGKQLEESELFIFSEWINRDHSWDLIHSKDIPSFIGFLMTHTTYQMSRTNDLSPTPFVSSVPPENVFFFTYSSPEEKKMGELFFNRADLTRFALAKGCKSSSPHNFSFIFGPADSALAMWVEGRTYSVAELKELIIG